MYAIRSYYGVKSKYGVALKSKNDTVIGFICVEYLYTPKEMDDTIKSEIYEKAAIISNLLNLEN